MEMTTVKSSNIESIGYDTKKMHLNVTFKNGKTFGYSGVNQQEYDNLLNADSLGKHFNQYVKATKPAFEILDVDNSYPDDFEDDSSEIASLRADYAELREHMINIEKVATFPPADRVILKIAREALNRL